MSNKNSQRLKIMHFAIENGDTNIAKQAANLIISTIHRPSPDVCNILQELITYLKNKQFKEAIPLANALEEDDVKLNAEITARLNIIKLSIDVLDMDSMNLQLARLGTLFDDWKENDIVRIIETFNDKGGNATLPLIDSYLIKEEKEDLENQNAAIKAPDTNGSPAENKETVSDNKNKISALSNLLADLSKAMAPLSSIKTNDAEQNHPVGETQTYMNDAPVQPTNIQPADVQPINTPTINTPSIDKQTANVLKTKIQTIDKNVTTLIDPESSHILQILPLNNSKKLPLNNTKKIDFVLQNADGIKKFQELVHQNKINKLTITFKGPYYDQNMTKFINIFPDDITKINFQIVLSKQVTNIAGLFANLTKLTCVSLFDTSKVTDASMLFYKCSALVNIPKFNFQNVIYLDSAFEGCSSIILGPNLNLPNAISIKGLYRDCTKLTSVPPYNIPKTNSFKEVFKGCPNFINKPSHVRWMQFFKDQHHSA